MVETGCFMTASAESSGDSCFVAASVESSGDSCFVVASAESSEDNCFVTAAAKDSESRLFYGSCGGRSRRKGIDYVARKAGRRVKNGIQIYNRQF